ncbi:MAG: hypothetical protein WAN66_14570 [Limnoraphis robusta]|jgi:hypothetical protein|uniref:Uncharacterized protein n=2 Tax=Limnoraphis robusta TaxID=1118279 RepID=A0A0F5YC27_9CYAN|nr:hypothetical protein [Limnoraphis robusta]MCG5059635.1 hypothetical protein [Limnoraphis sp. WC205]KKD36461.1 hypothetical protein WN50_19675 [Limnoraphis robusta CS-951]KMW70032.1 hypothetical protein WN50_38425 [Limnoraphis robusta CS-951]MEA5500493.1 hypothetical protein [Limnoraphis robusta BA-68 BA1]MEA5521725.1 hypothetical protein [Limnoraphis robusta CCNP1315]
MFGKSIKLNNQNLNNPVKISAAVALVTIGLLGVISETPRTPSARYHSEDHTEEINRIRQGGVTIYRYEVTDPTTGSAISVSKIQNQ